MDRTRRVFFAVIIPFVLWASVACASSTVDEETVRSAARSVVQVNAASSPEEAGNVGSGWVAAPDKVVTAAHVVAFQTVVWVRAEGAWPGKQAQVIAFDPARDIAVLEVPDLDLPPLDLADTAQPDTPAALLARRLDDATPVTREQTVTRTANVIVVGLCANPREPRRVVEFTGPIYQGDSGGPLVDGEGRVLAVATNNITGSTNAGTPADAVKEVLSGKRGTPVPADLGC